MHPRNHLDRHRDDPAVVMAGSNETLTYGELETRANRGAHLLRSCGLKRGDVIALMIENRPEFFIVYWAAQRCGLFITPISTRLTPGEAAYIVNDSGARVAILSAGVGTAASDLVARREELVPGVHAIFGLSGLAGADDWDERCAAEPDTPIGDESPGFHMVYSSGTTGKPKGVRIALPEGAVDAEPPFAPVVAKTYGVDQDTVYLSPAPLYHTAPLMYSTTVQRMGGTVIVMEKFDAEGFLAAVEKFGVTFSQLVPTMFIRMLKLPEEVRARYDLSSLRHIVHAAAPCPVPVKRQMLEWLGPIIYEYYGGSEGGGSTFITPEEWLAHPGSVGRTRTGQIHICDNEGNELPTGEIGTIYFSGGNRFEYLNDPDKTKGARHADHEGWSTIGDIGRVDKDGYLYLTDRKSFMIISGGVNIYPQEIEDTLTLHPKVADVAVFGIPNEDFGEEVKAVVQPEHWPDAGHKLAEELDAYCREHLSAIKCPRSIDFRKSLPRHDTGKLYKQKLRDDYLAKA
ncbi:acyl-CoA synthetase [uncultured Parasphingopyxis sp.]|uniref:acyl-CoA synthetase n=1 Tax=uncultured Parasphingopyxis sp. TaxID=1547918 RepID=UPI002614B782|nr:acyl-CoA synthetase [uncultured Parasphingopyxis sp.]